MEYELKDQFKKSLEDDRNIQVVYLEGKAPEQHNPQPVNIEGNICSPRRFADKREFDKTESHCLFSYDDMQITLVVNEKTVCQKQTVIGTIKRGKNLDKIGINNGTKYEPQSLSRLLRLKRSIFRNKDEHMNIVKTLNNLEAKVDAQLKDENNNKGSLNWSYQQKVTSNIPDSFTLNMPLIQGGEDIPVLVDVLLEIEGSQIYCILESNDAEDEIKRISKELIDNEIEKLEDKTTLISI